jgi:hypothetical protein
MTELRYYIPNLNSNNSYDIRVFKRLDEAAKQQIQTDLAFIIEARKQIVRVDRKMFQGKHGNHYLAEAADDEEIDNPFIIIRNKNGNELQYRADAFNSIILFCERHNINKGFDLERRQPKNENKYEIKADDSNLFSEIFAALIAWFEKILATDSSKTTESSLVGHYNLFNETATIAKNDTPESGLGSEFN